MRGAGLFAPLTAMHAPLLRACMHLHASTERKRCTHASARVSMHCLAQAVQAVQAVVQGYIARPTALSTSLANVHTVLCHHPPPSPATTPLSPRHASRTHTWGEQQRFAHAAAERTALNPSHHHRTRFPAAGGASDPIPHTHPPHPSLWWWTAAPIVPGVGALGCTATTPGGTLWTLAR